MRHPNLAERSDTCLVVIDMQEPFLASMFDRATVTENTRRLIQAAGVLGLPVIATVQNPERMGGSVPEIAELIGEEIPKLSFSCCGSDAFNEALAKTGRRTAVLCGVETHICVSQTAHDLAAGGITVHVPEDAVCSRTERNRRAGIDKMRQSGVVLTSTEAVIYEMLGCAGTDEFRSILKLVR
ncbi:MAG: hydrolase [Armatimonadota bacterium]